MDQILFRKRIRALAARLGILRPLRRIVFRLRGTDGGDKEREFLGRFIHPGTLVFDVGANRGQSSENYIELGALVVAFEPQVELHPEIRQLCRNSPRLTIESCGLGACEETRSFFMATYDQVASLRDDWEGDRIGEIAIQVSTLDSQIKKHGLPSYCKIDVEGWELEVIKGLGSAIPILSFEYHRSPEELDKAKEVLEQIARLGEYYCNIKEPSGGDFLLARFLPIEEFARMFPGGISPSPSSGYGDIFCTTDVQLIRTRHS